jgi:hypothetical protein
MGCERIAQGGPGLASKNVGVHASDIARVGWPPAAMMSGRIVRGMSGRKSSPGSAILAAARFRLWLTFRLRLDGPTPVGHGLVQR